MDELTPDEVQAIAAEIDTWNSRYPKEEQYLWRIFTIAHLDTPFEAYRLQYQNGYDEVWFRNEQGQLEPAQETVYFAPEYRTKGQLI